MTICLGKSCSFGLLLSLLFSRAGYAISLSRSLSVLICFMPGCTEKRTVRFFKKQAMLNYDYLFPIRLILVMNKTPYGVVWSGLHYLPFHQQHWAHFCVVKPNWSF